MSKVTMIGVDLAKNLFQLHAVDAKGRKVFAKRISRAKFESFIPSHEPCTFVMEACSGCHYWARMCFDHGHQAKLIHPAFVTPFVKTNKNDATDAEAICEAALRPNMRFVPVKNQEQLDIQALHVARKGCVRARTAMANRLRGLLAEHGIVIPVRIANLIKRAPHILEDMSNGLTLLARDNLSDIYSRMIDMDESVKKYTRILEKWSRTNDDCKRLKTIPGIDVICSTIIYAVAGDGTCFKNGRHFAAWLGLTPRQHSSGGKNRLLGISKHGNTYVRTMLIQGAHNLVRRKATPWITNLAERQGYKKACVAQANKTARIAWNVLTKKEPYREA